MSHSPRDEIKNLIKEGLSAKILQSSQKENITEGFPPKLNSMVEDNAENLLAQFEKNITIQQIKERLTQPFCYGVYQSIIGGILLFFVIGFLMFVIYGYRFNFWGGLEDLAKDVNQSNTIRSKNKQ